MNSKLVAKELLKVAKILASEEEQEMVIGSFNYIKPGTNDIFMFKVIDTGFGTAGIRFAFGESTFSGFDASVDINLESLTNLYKLFTYACRSWRERASGNYDFQGATEFEWGRDGGNGYYGFTVNAWGQDEGLNITFKIVHFSSRTEWTTPYFKPEFLEGCCAELERAIKHGLTTARSDAIREKSAEEELDPKYQNKDNTFKDMPPVDDPQGAKNGFNGCVKYMMDKKHKGLPQENAEKLCGWIKQHKG